jgi:zinc-ribbon domain
MASEKYCQNCGAKNQPYAAFCEACGTSFIPSPESPQTPPLPPPAEPLGNEPLYTAPPEPPRRFKKRYVLYGVLVLLALLIIAGAISASQQTVNRSIATPNTQASAIATIAPTPEVSASIAATATANASANASATPSTAASASPDYTSRLNTVGLGAGLVSASPFEKVTINGKQAYEGSLVNNGKTYNAQVYPVNSYSETIAFKDQLISAYESRGYVAYTPGNVGDTNLNIWYGLSGNTLVSISAMPTSQINTPVILVMTATT